MKAAVIHEHGGPGSITIDTNFPDPTPGEDDVVIKVQADTLKTVFKSSTDLVGRFGGLAVWRFGGLAVWRLEFIALTTSISAQDEAPVGLSCPVLPVSF